MRILVTGSSGFIGNHLCAALEDLGHEIIDFDIREGRDVCNLAQLKHYMRRARLVIHLAALNSSTVSFYTHPWQVLDVGVRGGMNIVEAAVANDIQHLVVVSSSEVAQEGVHRETSPLVIPDPTNPRFSYAASKILSEVVALTCKRIRKVQVVRPFNIYGPGQGVGHVIPDMIARAPRMKLNQPIPVMGANETRSFCHVIDFIEGFMLMLKKGKSGIWIVGNDTPTRIDKLAEMIYARAYPDAPPCIIVGAPGAPGAPATRIPDITKLRALGFEPKVSLEQGLADLMAAAL